MHGMQLLVLYKPHVEQGRSGLGKKGVTRNQGRWKGDWGQKAQCDMAKRLLEKIVDEYP